MFSLSLNPTKYPTEYWNNGLQLLMMHKYFSSQHSPFHNDIHEAPNLPVPLLFICFISLCCGQSSEVSQDPQDLSTTRHWPLPCWNQHQSHQPLEPNQAKPLHRGNRILWMVEEWTVTNWTLWKQTLLLRGQNVPRMTPLPPHPTSARVSQGVSAPLLLSQIPG